MGTVLWQLNDCWPVTSWAAIDGDGRRKPLWYALRRSYRDRLVTIQPRDGGLAAVVVNDSAEPWRGELSLARVCFDGERLAESSSTVDRARAGRRSRSPCLRRSANAGNPATEVVLAELDGVPRLVALRRGRGRSAAQAAARGGRRDASPTVTGSP